MRGFQHMSRLVQSYLKKHSNELFVFVLALVLHILMVADGARDPSWHSPVVDARTYHDLAKQLMSGRYHPITAFYQPPGLAYFLAAVYRLGGSSLAAAHVALCIMGSCTAMFACRLGKRLFRPRTGLLAGILTACYGPLLFFNLQLLPSGLAALLNMVFLELWFKAVERDKTFGYLVCGMSAGLAAVTIPNNLIFMPVPAAGLFVVRWQTYSREIPGEKHRNIKSLFLRSMVAPLWLTIGTLSAIAPVTAQNYLASGKFTLVSHNGGMNFYIGNNECPDATIAIRPGYEWEKFDKMPLREGLHATDAADRYYYRKSLTWILNEPGEFLFQLGRKIRQVTNARELPRNIDIYCFRDYFRLLRPLLWRAGPGGFPFGLFFPLTCLGIVMGVRVNRRAWLPASFVAVYLFSVALYFVTARYRLVAVPAMSIFAAVALDFPLWYRKKKSHLKVLAVLIPGLAAVWCNSPVETATDDYNFHSELYALLSLQKTAAGRFDEAERMTAKALETGPEFAPAWRAAGFLDFRRGNLAAAQEAYRTATRCDPRDAEAFHNLGRVSEGLGQAGRAEWAYRRAFAISPETSAIMSSLAHSAYRRGDRHEAAALLEAAIANDLTTESAYGLLAWIRATAPEDELRDGNRALSLISFLIRWRGSSDPMRLDTLAAALAECGRFKEAQNVGAAVVERWQDSGREDVAEKAGERLRRYQNNLPVRE